MNNIKKRTKTDPNTQQIAFNPDEITFHPDEIKKLRELLQSLKPHQPKKKKRGRPKGDFKINFCLSMPYKLYTQLKNYLETYGEKGETMASVIIAGTEKELKERIAKKLTKLTLDSHLNENIQK